MSNVYVQRLCRYTLACMVLSVSVLFTTNSNAQQIWDGTYPGGEGLSLVGPAIASGWTTPAPTNSSYASETQILNGGMKVLTGGVRRWHCTYQSTVSGTNDFLYISGPAGGYFNNAWKSVNVVFNTYQPYTYQSGANNTITTTTGKWYTTNWRDIGYTGPTNGVWMETTNAPVTVSSSSQSPLSGNVTPADPVDITVTTSGALSLEEKVYIRWTTNSYTTSNLLQVTMVGNSGTAQIPAQVDGTSIQYYVFTSTGTTGQITTNYDMFTINSGGGDSYTSTALPPVNITFQVDMANEAVSGNGVHVACSFNSFTWNYSKLRFT